MTQAGATLCHAGRWLILALAMETPTDPELVKAAEVAVQWARYFRPIHPPAGRWAAKVVRPQPIRAAPRAAPRAALPRRALGDPKCNLQ